MRDFVVSDIHGCYLTFMKLLHRHYDKNNMRLVLLGDYLDKGAYPYEMWRWLSLHFDDPMVILLRGNHEQEFIEYNCSQEMTCWYRQDGITTIEHLLNHNVDLKEVVCRFSQMPLCYDCPHVFYSHAGVSIFKHDKTDPNDPCGLLWNRLTVENLGKLQVYGHTPHLTGPIYQAFSQSYMIDTGVFLNGWLSALVIDEKGTVLNVYREKTDPKDFFRREFIR